MGDEDIVRLILDGTVIRTRLDRKAKNISVLAAIGVRRDGQKVLLSVKNMGGESTSAWRQFLDDLDARGLNRPEFVIVDGAPGLEAALVALWGEALPIQRCTVHSRVAWPPIKPAIQLLHPGRAVKVVRSPNRAAQLNEMPCGVIPDAVDRSIRPR